MIGAGYVTVLESAEAACSDGPRGCVINNVRVTLLATGDRFDSQSKVVRVAAGKQEIAPGKETSNGNFLIPDINGEGAARSALLDGLADNSQRKQEGIALKHYGEYAHGYRFTFQKDASTRAFEGHVGGFHSYTVLKVRLDIEPITGALRPAATFVPADLASCTNQNAVLGVSFRGILPIDHLQRFRPADAITRQELAQALSRCAHLLPRKSGPLPLLDVSDSFPAADDIQRVLAAGMMDVEPSGRFRPLALVTRREAASIFVKIAERLQGTTFNAPQIEITDLQELDGAQRRTAAIAVDAGWLPPNAGKFQPALAVTRQEAAVAIHQIIDLP